MPNAYKMNAVIQADCFQIRTTHTQKKKAHLKTDDKDPSGLKFLEDALSASGL